MAKINIIPIFVPHLGCPHDCVFCNQIRITGKSTNIDANYVYDTVYEYLKYFRDSSNTSLAFYGGSFTAIEKNLRLQLLKAAKSLVDRGLIKSVRLSTRPDYINDEILEELKDNSVREIELGVQSLNKRVLDLSKRGHGLNPVYESAKLIKRAGFKLGLQQMIGLPGDDLDKSLYTAREFIKIAPDFVRIYPTLVIKDTELAQMYEDKIYKPLSLFRAVDVASKISNLYNLNDINIIRVGLQNTEDINYDADVLAGPFHPAFGELVKSHIYLISLIGLLEQLNIYDDDLEIFATASNISKISAQNSHNKRLIANRFRLRSLKIKSKNLDAFEIGIKTSGICKIYDIRRLFEKYSLCT